MSSFLHELGIEPRALVVNIAGFVLLLWLLRRYVFDTIRMFIERRKQAIADDLDTAEQEKKQARKQRQEIQQHREQWIGDARQQAEEITTNSEDEAEQIVVEAREQARRTEKSAQASIEEHRRQAEAQLRDRIAQAAADMSRAVISQALDEQRHRALMDQFIAEVENMAAEKQDQE